LRAAPRTHPKLETAVGVAVIEDHVVAKAELAAKPGIAKRRRAAVERCTAMLGIRTVSRRRTMEGRSRFA